MITTNLPFAPSAQKKSQEGRGPETLPNTMGEKAKSSGKFDEHLQNLDVPQKTAGKALPTERPAAREAGRSPSERIPAKAKALEDRPQTARPAAKQNASTEPLHKSPEAKKTTETGEENTAAPNPRSSPPGKRITKAEAKAPGAGRDASPLDQDPTQQTTPLIAGDLESEEPGNPFPEESDIDWKRRLEEMMALSGLPAAAFVQSMPSLALLTGQLEYIEPQAIPAVISETPVIQQFLSAESPEAIVDQVKPLGAWLKDMGWSEKGIKGVDAAALEELLATPVSLRDLMEGFNVDVSRVLQEAQILQEALPLDGFKPYMERAIRLQGGAGAKTPEARTAGPQAAPAPMPIDRVPQEHSEAEWATAALLAQGMFLADAGESGLRPLDLQTLPPDSLQRLVASLDIKTPELSPRAAIESQLTLQSQPQALPQALSTPMPTPTPMAMQQVPLSPAVDPRMAAFFNINPAVQDPFQSLMSFAPTQTHSFSAVRAGGQADLLAVPSMDLLQQLQASQIQSQSMEFIPESLAPGADSGLEFAAQATFVEEAFLGERSGNEGGREERSFSDSSSDQPQSLASQPGGAGRPEFKAEEAAAKAERAAPAVMKEIFDSSSVLIKDGGGSMRLDLGNKEIGELSLAVEVKDGNVEIKILTPSPEARELLANELPRLREALQNQNLDLKKVEITLGGNSSWTQTSSDGRQQSRRDESQTFEEKSIRGVNGSGRMSKSYSQTLQSQQSQGPVYHNGAIQVRV